MKYCVVFVTAPKISVARKLAKVILDAKLCACVNIVKSVDSFFWWESKIDKAKEALLIIKTKSSLFKKLEKAVKAAHPYEVPEIIAMPIFSGSSDYLNWMEESCRKKGR